MKKFALLLVPALFLVGCSEPETKVETKTETVEVTPQVCVDALDAAEALVGGPVVEGMEDTVVLVDLIDKAFQAGLNMDEAAVNEIVATMEDVNVRTEQRTAEIDRLVSEYNKAAEACRGEGGNV